MNWLAHVFLSEPDAEMRLGNLLADVVKGKDRRAMTDRFLRGVACHQAIDSFTDFHPVASRTRARLRGEHGRVSGILVDVFYDHCLARNWGRYCPVPLERFAGDFYADALGLAAGLPERAREMVFWMVAENRLVSYREPGGIEAALESISLRLAARVGTDFGLVRAVQELERDYPAIEADFLEFFPALQERVAAWLVE
jgi:acyl carrier protein phosphodiesterase